MNDFLAAMIAHGLRPRRAPVPDGRVYRCPTESHPKRRNGAYMLAPDGEFGWFRDWARDDNPIVWRADAGTRQRERDPEEERRRAEAIASRRREDRERRRRATLEAREFYAGCEPLLGGHPYLEDHGLDMTGCRGLRRSHRWPAWDPIARRRAWDYRDWLVIPAVRRGEVISLQAIDHSGEKKFWPGATTKAVSYVIDRPGATITVLCEGLATGLAIFAASPLVRVVVAFTAGNLVDVAKILEPKGWGMLAVAADNDQWTVCRVHRDAGLDRPFAPWEERPSWCQCNPGRMHAEAAAAVLGCGVMLPELPDGTDWCDWRNGMVAHRLERRPYGSRETEASIRRAVDAELERAVMRAANRRRRQFA